MTTDQQELWLRAAIEALQDIRVGEVRMILLELQRSIKRPNEIVPEIARLVSERRARASVNRQTGQLCTCGKGAAVNERTGVHWAKRDGATAIEPCHTQPAEPPLTAAEIDRMPKWIQDMGLRVGFLKRVGDRLVDAT